jgi:antagonist of KipI
MKNLRIIKPGILDTVQDPGRFGYQHLGINPGGAMDQFSARVGNILVGNDPGDPVIELHFPASEFFFERPALISVTGADFNPTINGDPFPINHPVFVNKFSVLQFKKLKQGARTYLSVRGGFGIEKWLGSYSTNLKAKAGGFKGRAFRKDDEMVIAAIEPGNLTSEFEILPYYANYTNGMNGTNGVDVGNRLNEVFVLKGKEWEWLDDSQVYKFLSSEFLITPQSDRMGYRLRGEGLMVEDRRELISSPVSFGTIQLLPDGQLIILMADHQSTGGYPRVGHVITAHHSLLAQKRAGEKIRFKLVEIEEAEELFMEQEKYLLQLEHSLRLRFEPQRHKGTK